MNSVTPNENLLFHASGTNISSAHLVSSRFPSETKLPATGPLGVIARYIFSPPLLA